MSEELKVALAELKRAADFYKKVYAHLKARGADSNAYETGAVKDAHEWLRDTSLRVAELAP